MVDAGLLYFLSLVYLFVPAYLANGSPPVLAKLPVLRRWGFPADFRLTFCGERLLGDNKTLRGVLIGTLIGGLAFLAQKYLLTDIIDVPAIPYGSLPWHYGLLLAAGAILVGDCGKSFIKRRLGIAPGGTWAPFDQLDYTLGAFLLTFWLFWPGWTAFLFLLAFNAVLSLLFHLLAHRARLLKDPV